MPGSYPPGPPLPLSPANGGTGLASPGASGNVLTSNGSGAWTSAAPAGGGTFTGTAQTFPFLDVFYKPPSPNSGQYLGATTFTNGTPIPLTARISIANAIDIEVTSETITDGTVDITGTLANGTSKTVTITLNRFNSGGQVYTQPWPFIGAATITMHAVGNAGGDTVSVGCTSVFGLSVPANATGLTILQLAKNGDPDAWTLDATHQTVMTGTGSDGSLVFTVAGTYAVTPAGSIS